jgi:hypothetical protein
MIDFPATVQDGAPAKTDDDGCVVVGVGYGFSSNVEDASHVSPLHHVGLGTTTRNFLREEIVAFGGIQDPMTMASRSSDSVRA